MLDIVCKDLVSVTLWTTAFHGPEIFPPPKNYQHNILFLTSAHLTFDGFLNIRNTYTNNPKVVSTTLRVRECLKFHILRQEPSS